MIKSKQIDLKYAKNCQSLYPKISELFEKEVLVQKFLKDIFKFSKLDLITLKYGCKYLTSLNILEKEIDDSITQKVYQIKLERPLSLDMAQEARLRKKSTIVDYESTEDNSVVCEEDKNNGFKPSSYIMSGMTSGIQNMKIKDEIFVKNILKIIKKNRIIKSENLETCKKFFIKYTISDIERRELWRKRVGNKLAITKTQYKGLEMMLKEKGIPEKIDRVITNDLKRTFPDCRTYSEGRSMYQKMQKILRLLHIYRPDVSYVQGMTYLLTPLYYYYDEFESFLLLANLVISNKFLFTMYSFDMTRVRF